ncbi:hypothetical protein BACCAP_02350 [Pseudoflavonifractor capillosus ATCC 29799]|uniref:Uncharacterized protein n=1 Tax=Pseudoflavonifractor capillosus ATCC 29799 TaxID=411467 RepID=A6NVV7_9FIRM|nr:hypothetical protein BACCAP_02350 [Pseudoflavonifractor capillosus ATCC 29799]
MKKGAQKAPFSIRPRCGGTAISAGGFPAGFFRSVRLTPGPGG